MNTAVSNTKSKKETSGTSSSPALTRGVKPNAKLPKKAPKKTPVPARKAADKSESQGSRKGTFREADGFLSRGRFVEVLDKAADGGSGSGKRLRVVLLREGLGNLGDCFFYTQAAIESAVPVFEGAQFYTDHPAEDEEMNRPERSVKDIAGYFENIKAERAADGCMELLGDLVIVDSPAFERERALMVESVTYSKKHTDRDLVGLSINASGDYEECEVNAFMAAYNVPSGAMQKLQEAIAKGMTIIRPTKEINSAVSCDLVTVAGAGGRISQLLERGNKMSKKTDAEKKAEADRLEADRKAKLKESEEAALEAGDMEAEESEEDAMESEESADGEDGDHPDADKDMELISGLLKKSLGDGFTDEHKQKAKETYERAKAMFPDDEKEAMKCAEYNLKMAFHSPDSGAGNPQGVENPPAAKKESAKKKAKESDPMVDLAARLAKVEARNAELELGKIIEDGIVAAKLPAQAEKRFRESVLKSVKTADQFKERLGMFQEALAAVPAGDSEDGFVISAEKNIGEDGGEAGLSFEDCQVDE